ncbi:hypothetical protein [Aliirhizobium cellulosilyticum]|uniref:Uncharacterized protein n=1 Tax=Aliirhizobium cellulosilyticum TaxID=393664 RepID=A0A7W6V419_9HYPH|nr:hypothetical protein [Rhizobium cellulosilyticum]MBB4350707.1 hypothetical protein [Rhizobium cellulosilyticum]MBB4413902.1 hypothetical protein [Rhizobium cellulosilyticum]MBB4448517.1 hypothetical protein [Rhizobium cellulosilyticum]
MTDLVTFGAAQVFASAVFFHRQRLEARHGSTGAANHNRETTGA